MWQAECIKIPSSIYKQFQKYTRSNHERLDIRALNYPSNTDISFSREFSSSNSTLNQTWDHFFFPNEPSSLSDVVYIKKTEIKYLLLLQV